MAHDLETSCTRGESHIGLLMEMAIVWLAVLGLLALARHVGDRRLWLAVPWVLTLGAVLPTVARGRCMRELGLQRGRIAQDLGLLCVGAVSVFILGMAARVVLTHLGGQALLAAVLPRDRWLQWVFFQVACVALPEELFFRGYLLGNGIRLLRSMLGAERHAVEYCGIVLSAGVFALSHALILGNTASILTFFPGLIFSWLFVRIQTLVAPVLLHAAANVGYAIMAREVV